ncbi:MAG: hypothetical protein ACYT04_58690, partial [Nostoc sp.]
MQVYVFLEKFDIDGRKTHSCTVLENSTKRIGVSLRTQAKTGGAKMSKNPYIGSSLDDLVEEDGTLEEINLIAAKRVIAWQISKAMEEKKLN